MKKITKSNGNCIDSTGTTHCEFLIEENTREYITPSAKLAGRPKTCIVKSFCGLFNHTEKYLSNSLQCCNKIYGDTYEGNP